MARLVALVLLLRYHLRMRIAGRVISSSTLSLVNVSVWPRLRHTGDMRSLFSSLSIGWILASYTFQRMDREIVVARVNDNHAIFVNLIAGPNKQASVL